MWKILERIEGKLGLHHRLEIWWKVDGYVVDLRPDDGYGPILVTGEGSTIFDALMAFDQALRHSTTT